MKRIISLSVTLVALFLTTNAMADAQWWLEPTFGATEVTSGFLPDPVVHELTAGGGSNPQDVSELGYSDTTTESPCVGFVTRSPDYRIQFEAGTMDLLRIYVETDNGADAMLLINAPDASWHCNDDSFETLMPTVDFQQPVSGQYDVWVGTYDGTSSNPARLMITELDSNHP